MFDTNMGELVAFDFETATHKADSACALGIAVLAADGNIKEKKYWLIKPPGNKYYSKNIQIHGITPEQTIDAQPFGELWPQMQQYFENRDLLAHYALFDTNVLSACLYTSGIEQPSIGNVYCSCITARRNLQHLPNHKLPTVCQELGIKLLNHHNAVDDVLACAMIAHKLKDKGLAGMSWQQAINHSLYQKEFFKKV